jgi:hypothetical protein
MSPAKSADEYPLACYGVEARRQQTLPFPQGELVTTDDPEDPIFYSSCYVRTKVIEWLPTGPEKRKQPNFVFHGVCLDCKTYEENLKTPNETALDVPLWLTSQCKDCTATKSATGIVESRLAPAVEAVAAENPKGLSYSWVATAEGAGTITGLVLGSLLAIAIYVWYRRRSQRKSKSLRILQNVEMQMT